jgi:hypothetical protein
MATILNGTSCIIKANGDTISFGKTANFKRSMATRETTTKDSAGWKGTAEAIKSGSFDFKGLLSYNAFCGFVDLWSYASTRTMFEVVYDQDGTTYTANAYITSLNQSGELEGSVEFDATFEITGAIS